MRLCYCLSCLCPISGHRVLLRGCLGKSFSFGPLVMDPHPWMLDVTGIRVWVLGSPSMEALVCKTPCQGELGAGVFWGCQYWVLTSALAAELAPKCLLCVGGVCARALWHPDVEVAPRSGGAGVEEKGLCHLEMLFPALAVPGDHWSIPLPSQALSRAGLQPGLPDQDTFPFGREI